MIRLSDRAGRSILLNPEHVAQVQEASTSQAWHGVSANVQMATDARWIEVRESVADIERMVQEATR